MKALKIIVIITAVIAVATLAFVVYTHIKNKPENGTDALKSETESI